MELLGYRVRDKITGFSGVVTGYVTYLTGCNQALVVPPVGDDGAFKEGQWFDEQRLDFLPAFERIMLDNGSHPGPDRAPPKR